MIKRVVIFVRSVRSDLNINSLAEVFETLTQKFIVRRKHIHFSPKKANTAHKFINLINQKTCVFALVFALCAQCAKKRFT